MQEKETSKAILEEKLISSLVENIDKELQKQLEEILENQKYSHFKTLSKEELVKRYLNGYVVEGKIKKWFKKLFEHEIKIRDFYFNDCFKDLLKPILKIYFINCHFENVDFEDKILYFKRCEFEQNIAFLRLYKCTIESEFILKDKTYIINELDFSESTFNLQCKVENCRITKSAKFINTKFNHLADFYKTSFSEVNFERADFNKVAVFAATLFHQDLNFKYVKFGEKSVFSKMVVKGRLNLKDAIFEDSAKFLEVSSSKKIEAPINVANRETARVIKDFYEKSNNIIEANRFYALEMKEREKELSLNKWDNFSDYITFKIHSLTSNHSQDWVLTLYWIVAISFIYVHLQVKTHMFLSYSSLFFYLALSLFVAEFFINFKKDIFKQLFRIFLSILFLISYQFSSNDFYLTEFSKAVNPTLIVRYKEDMNMLALIYKVIVTYLVYQLIISIRQNTRRK